MTEQARPTVDVRAWDPGSSAAAAEFDRVIELHRASKATLGHLPFAAFEEAGKRQRLVLGVIEGEVLGYVLYSTPRHHTLKLVHVCVCANAREGGLAKAMVEFAITANPDRSTISAHCRSDYGVDGFWRSLDMTPETQKPGRASSGSTLTVWARRIGQRDLLEEALYASTRPLAVLDSNVLIDLYVSDVVQRPDRQESLGLAEDWVVDLIELTYSPEVHVDVNAFPLPEERARIQSRLTALVPVRRDAGMKSLAIHLLAQMPQHLVAKDASLSNDAKHLADAILAGADYFVTRDVNLLLATRDWIQAEHHIEVARPVELLQRLLPTSALSQFRSDLLESVGLTWTRLTASESAVEESFVAHSAKEKATFLRKQLQAVLARPATAQLEVLGDERGRRWALLGTELTQKGLSVPVLRVARGLLGSTIAFQLVRHLRAVALAQGACSISVTEGALDAVIRAALEADGFANAPLTVEIAEHPNASLAASIYSTADVMAYERTNWPQVLLDREVPVWVIPIQPTYARNLIGYNDTLISGREKLALGLSREFVYFSAPTTKSWNLPARALWYVTKDEGAKDATAVRAVVAFSRIVDYAVVDVPLAVEQYRSFGVLKEQEIADRASKGRILALRFEDTQMLREPIGRNTLGQLLKKYDVNLPLLTARSVPPGLFDEVLRMQRGYETR